MDTPEARQKAQGGSVEDWATESLLAARAGYQDPATGQRLKPGTKLGDAYQEKALPVAKQRLYQSSLRLAMVLNEVLPQQIVDSSSCRVRPWPRLILDLSVRLPNEMSPSPRRVP